MSRSILVSADGCSLRCVYGEELDLREVGDVRIWRASHVEPDDQGQWWADLSPASGPKLGPFARRTGALQAEDDWLELHPPAGWAAGTP